MEFSKMTVMKTRLSIFVIIPLTPAMYPAGKNFYGPDGVYPFAGRECARAFAMVSTEVSDCNASLEGLSAAEMDSLYDWESRFYNKYPIIGNLISDEASADAARQELATASHAA